MAQRREVVGPVVIVWLLGCGCSGDVEQNPASRQAVAEPEVRLDAPAVPGGVEVGVLAPVPKTIDEVRADNEALRQRGRDFASAPVWRERLARATLPDTSIAIVKLVAVVGGVLAGKYHSTEVSVVTHVKGPALPASFNLLQFASFGEVFREGGFTPRAERTYVVLVSPSPRIRGAFELLLDFDTLAYGWGEEQAPGVFRFRAGPSDLDLADLQLLDTRSN